MWYPDETSIFASLAALSRMLSTRSDGRAIHPMWEVRMGGGKNSRDLAPFSDSRFLSAPDEVQGQGQYFILSRENSYPEIKQLVMRASTQALKRFVNKCITLFVEQYGVRRMEHVVWSITDII